MITRFKDVKGQSLLTCEGEVGKIIDVLFDDKRWGVRYFVVDTSAWLPYQKVLLSPSALTLDESNGEGVYKTHLTKDQVRHCPRPEDDPPVNQQRSEKVEILGDWAAWPEMVSVAASPNGVSSGLGSLVDKNLSSNFDDDFDSNLRSCSEIVGYKIMASSKASRRPYRNTFSNSISKAFNRRLSKTFSEVMEKKQLESVEDILIDSDEWMITDVTIASSSWVANHSEHICSPIYVTNINASERLFEVELSRSNILRRPKFDPSTYDEHRRKSLVKLHCRKTSYAKPLMEKQPFF